MSVHTGPAEVRFTDSHVLVLCPMGHMVTAARHDGSFGGSYLESRISHHQTNGSWIVECDGAVSA